MGTRSSRAAFLAALLLLPFAPAGLPGVDVTIDVGTAHQVMDGFGSTVRIWDDPHLCDCWDPQRQRGAIIPPQDRDRILQLVYRDLGLTRVRPATEAGVEVANDNADPNFTDLSAFNFEWKRNDEHMEYVERAMAYADITHFLSPIVLESWMTEENPEEYAEWAFTILRRWRDRGLEPRYYSLMNEPGYSRGGVWSREYLSEAIKILGKRLREDGMQTRFVISDDLNATEAYRRCRFILDDPVARQYVGALAYHLYGGSAADMTRMADLGRTYGLPVWMTEYSSAEYTGYEGGLRWARRIHELVSRYRVSAVDYMWAFFGDWSESRWPGNTLIPLQFEGLTYRGYTLTERYYFTGQYARFVRPGALRVDARSSPPLEVTAYAGDDQLVVVAINPEPSSVEARFVVTGLGTDRQVRSFGAVRTSGSQRWESLEAIAASGSGFETVLPAKSVTTYSGLLVPPGERFQRGNANGDGATDLSDAVFVLNYLFLGRSAPSCEDSADSDDNGALEITDGIYLLNYLFLGGPGPGEPAPSCGLDPTSDDLTCESPAACREP